MRLACLILACAALAGPGQAQTTLTLPLGGATLAEVTYLCDRGALIEVDYLNAGDNRLALLPIVLTLGLLALQLFYYGDFTPHIPLILGLAITGLLGVLRGQGWMDIREGVFHVIHVSMPSLSVLLLLFLSTLKRRLLVPLMWSCLCR